ncbi:metal-sensitive transcriptional regulator [Streptomyces sp. P17]|uniref:metal-sensitive transcriptional regulator n=1 Tax=Streptomyces sp. P17 TaxID=3074716 RepID=UPI0028F3EE68|nr:metal-sensitive transcriptional regulator [Streptomyces sp. P17]MDT9698405.1 metal-sensitive transcriptional regulator [Streptomyces sp. P17]
MTGYHDQKDDIVRRLRRIEGQVRGLQRMVEEDAYCINVLTQVAATNAALQSCALALLDRNSGIPAGQRTLPRGFSRVAGSSGAGSGAPSYPFTSPKRVPDIQS